MVSVRVKLRRPAKPTYTKRYDLANIPNDVTVATTNKYEVLSQIVEEPTSKELWVIFKEAATRNVQKASHRKKTAFLSARTIAKAKERRKMKARSASIRETNSLTWEIQRYAREGKNAALNKICEEIEGHHHNNKTKELFQVINKQEATSTCRCEWKGANGSFRHQRQMARVLRATVQQR